MLKQTSSESTISISEIDTKRFGFPIAKSIVKDGVSISNIFDFCRNTSVKLLIVKCKTDSLKMVHEMEMHGFILCDTLLWYINRDICTSNTRQEKFLTKIATVDDASDVEQISIKAFKNFKGHYHSDRRLNENHVNEVYASWAKNSCETKELADVVLIAVDKNRKIGFLTAKLSNPNTANISLNAVLPEFQKQGVYSELILKIKLWCIDNNISTLTVSTQVDNIAPQIVWIRNGFEPHQSYYTFHKWFD